MRRPECRLAARTRDTCYANDRPDLLPEGRTAVDPRTSEYCHSSTSWSGGTQFKALFVMPLPWGIQASANYQNKGPISLPASESFSNLQIAPSLGRDLSACGSRTGAACTARQIVTVVLPDTNYFEPRFNQLDLRFGRYVPAERRHHHSAAGRLVQCVERQLGPGGHLAVRAGL